MRNETAQTSQKGFTLVELLVVIVIIAILAIVVFVALNPAQRFADSRDAHRWSDVNSILTAIHEYLVDNGGSYPPALVTLGTATTGQIGTAATGCGTTDEGNGCGTQDGCVNLSGATNLANYLASLPVDPQESDQGETGYSVVRNAAGIVTITACNGEGGETIQVSR